MVLITSSFWWYGSRTEELVYANTRNTCSVLVDPILVRRHWWGTRTDKEDKGFDEWIAELAKGWQSKPFEHEIINLKSKKIDLPQYSAADKAVYERFLRLEPYLPDNKLSDEQSGLQYQNSHQELFEERRETINGKEKYIYYQPIYASRQDCVKCHANYGESGLAATGSFGSKPMELGNLLAVVKVILPDQDTQQAINWNRAILLATAIITVFMAMIAAYVIVRYVIVKPLKHLRDVSETVSRGDFDARADIQTADEFEDLAKAFNKMLRHLVNSQEELKQVNDNLDGKVDELAQVNMKLYEMNRLKSDFLATMSHELRTPLNSIIGFSDVLSSIKALDEKQHRYVGNIQKSGRMLLDMINDILDLAKIESGKMEIKASEFPVENIISAQCDMAKPLAERKNIDLLCDVEADVRPLYQDMGKVQQILNNLLSNAIKFTPEGGRIVVAAKEDSETGDLLLSVADNGVGIAVEDQTTIFEKFRQGGQVLARGDAMTREYSGTGLGLSIVKEICKLLGGEITLKSELGQGSTFTVRLPWVLGNGELNAGMATKPSFKALT